MTSEAAGRVGDGELDFASIDARHDYDSVLQDLEWWYPHMRASGALAEREPAQGCGARAHRKNPSWLLQVPR